MPNAFLLRTRRSLPVLLVFLAAAGLRLWRIGEMQFQFDEWLGGWHANPALRWEGSLPAFLEAFWTNARHYVTSGQTVLWSSLVEFLKIIAGPSVTAVRTIAALGGAVGAAAVFVIARKLFPNRPAAAVAAALVSIFGLAGIVFGQFADVYASAVFASASQLAVYFLCARPRNDVKGWLLFSAAAVVAGLFMYTQVWLTAGIFLCAVWEGLFSPRPEESVASRLLTRRTGVVTGVTTLQASRGRLAPLLPGVLLYGGLSAAHLYLVLRIIPWSESFRWYMDSYYPMFWRGEEGVGVLTAAGYFLTRLYDLFNYHLSLVFDPRVYQPLRWNWVSLPFLLVLTAGVICRIGNGRSKRKKVISDQLSVISKKIPGGRESPTLHAGHLLLITDHCSLITASSAVPRLLITTLAVCLGANAFFLIPFGGVRQMFFLLPIFALFYGWLVSTILDFCSVVTSVTTPVRRHGSRHGSRHRSDDAALPPWRRLRRGDATQALGVLLCLLPIFPFALSLPGLYSDRISRLDLSLVMEKIERSGTGVLLASEQNIQILEMALQAYPGVTDVHWPGYPYPCDALDADFQTAFPTLHFTYRGRTRTIHWIKRGYFPPEVREALWVDMHISRDSRFEGPRMKRFYPAPGEVVPAGYRIEPIREIPGNAPAALHQSIYWPPNSFYLYRVVKGSSSL